MADAFGAAVILMACGEDCDTLGRCVQTVDLDDVPVRNISQEGLLRTRQTMCDKDCADGVILERAIAMLHGGDADGAQPEYRWPLTCQGVFWLPAYDQV